MINNYFTDRLKKYKDWWSAPVNLKSRVYSAILSGMAGFWIAALGRITLGTLPVSLSVIGWFALSGIAIGILFGALFPKTMRLIAFPFAFWGIS